MDGTNFSDQKLVCLISLHNIINYLFSEEAIRLKAKLRFFIIYFDYLQVLEYFMKNILNKKLLIEDLTVYKKWMINYIIYFKSIIKAKSSLLCKLMKHLVIVQNLKGNLSH